MESYICPLLLIIVIAVIYWLLRSFKQDIRQQMDDFKTALLNNLPHKEEKTNLSLMGFQLQAYERMTLFLERIHPSNMIPRVLKPGQNISQFQSLLLQSIREEYEHNLSQQLYISDLAWESCKATKENIIQLIIRTVSGLNPSDDAGILAQHLLTSGFENDNDPVGKTLQLLKKEIRQIH